MSYHLPTSHSSSEDVQHLHLPNHDTVLVCKKTPTGMWVCCSDDGDKRCAHGFTPESAAAKWERVQTLHD